MNYYIANNGKAEGPYTPEQLRQMGLNASTMVWNETMSGWMAAGQVPDLTPYLNGAAPFAAPGFTGGNNFSAPIQETPAVCPKTWLVESILVTLFCCLPFGIVGIVKASQVESLFHRGDYQGALQSSKDAGKWTKIGFFLGLAGTLIYLILVIIGAVAGTLD